MDADELGVDGFAGRTQPGAVELEAIFEGEPGAVEALVAIGSLEANADGVIAVEVEGLVISRGEGDIVGVEDAAGRLVGHRHQADAPGVVSGSRLTRMGASTEMVEVINALLIVGHWLR